MAKSDSKCLIHPYTHGPGTLEALAGLPERCLHMHANARYKSIVL